MKKNKSTSPTKLYIMAGIVSFLITQLYMYALYMSTLYAMQKSQKKLFFYQEEKEKYAQELTLLQHSAHIKLYAKNVLNMRPLSLEKIKKMTLKKDNT